MTQLTNQDIAVYVRKRREARGVSTRQLAREAGVSRYTIMTIERGHGYGHRLDTLNLVLGALGLRLEIGEVV